MLGRDHALSGALAFTAVAPLLQVTGAHLAAAVVLTAGAGVLPDIDEPGSTIARTFGFLTGAFAWMVHKISGGHRKGTHSLLGVALVAAASLGAASWQAGARASGPWWHLVPAGLILALLFSAAFRALNIGGHHGDAFGIALAAVMIWKGWDLDLVTPRHLPVLAVCVTLGMLAHLAGDMCTHDGCPLLYPFSRYEFGLLPAPVRITTNKIAEHWIVTPLLIAGITWFLWRDTGSVLTAHVHLAGRLSGCPLPVGYCGYAAQDLGRVLARSVGPTTRSPTTQAPSVARAGPVRPGRPVPLLHGLLPPGRAGHPQIETCSPPRHRRAKGRPWIIVGYVVAPCRTAGREGAGPWGWRAWRSSLRQVSAPCCGSCGPRHC
jgi:membrane-bound metal-dependent hydrolase YbcI (DUF457 family)